MDNFQTIEYLESHPIDTLFCGNLWPIAALLCKIADAEGLPISAAVRKIAAKHPSKVDQEYPSLRDGEAAEEQYLQRRAKMIHTLKTEIQNLYVYANEKKVLAQLPGYDPAKQGKGGQR